MDRKKMYPGYMMVIPLIIFGIFFLLPSTVGFGYAFTDWSAYNTDLHFTGLSNFKDVLTERTVSTAFVNTLIFAGVKTVVVTVLGFVFAIPLNNKFMKSTKVLRTIYFLPSVLSTLVVGLIFNAVYESRHGIMNGLLTAVGLEELIQPWLGSRWPAVFSICSAEVWRNIGYAVVITLAGLQSVNSDYIEAAEVDGASGMQKFWKITLPLILPSVNVNILFSLIYGLKMFDLVYVMTGGGPGHDTETFGTLMMNEMASGRFAHSVAINMVFTVILVIVAVLFQKYSERCEYVE